MLSPMLNQIGTVTTRYKTGVGRNDMLFADPGISATNWQFPTNLFPGVGWLGRVHRGTPWQTVYLKSDNPSGDAQPVAAWAGWVNSPFTYPTNDWSLIDLFTAVPNDNAARGLLSVNQTNDAAWAAVFGGVVVISNITGIGGTLRLNPTSDVYYLMDSTNGINAMRRTSQTEFSTKSETSCKRPH